jgi:hypothetical protein
MTKQTIRVEGTVGAVSQKEKGWSIKVNGKWFGYWKGKITKPSKGDYVALDYCVSEDGQWNNIEEITVSQTQATTAQFAREEKATTMLVAYAKDLVVAKSDLALDAANELIWNSYEFFSKKLKGGEQDDKENS